MNGTAIRTAGLGKRYRLRTGKAPARSASERVSRVLASPFEWLLSQMRDPTEDEVLWALRDVDVEISEGQIVGIIGLNGAGKSTFLKLLSHITEPTVGRAEIHGRVGSLIEIGTGFHSELTGRENVYMNGSILGMKKTEIDRKLDEIVAFAGVEKFLDTPIKRYSSGMSVRLGFSVAAHLDCDILLVDEVLAVGDVGFQTKCLDRIRELTRSGVTTLIVSHNMASIQRLCERVVWFHDGKVECDAETSVVLNRYVDHVNSVALETVGKYMMTAVRRGSGEVRLQNVQAISDNGAAAAEYQMNEAIHIRATYETSRAVPSPQIVFAVRDVRSGAIVTSVRKLGVIPDLSPKQRGHVDCRIEPFGLRPGRYAIMVILGCPSGQRVSYDVWDGAGAEFIISARNTTSEADFIVGHDRALVSAPSIVTHSHQ